MSRKWFIFLVGLQIWVLPSAKTCEKMWPTKISFLSQIKVKFFICININYSECLKFGLRFGKLDEKLSGFQHVRFLDVCFYNLWFSDVIFKNTVNVQNPDFWLRYLYYSKELNVWNPDESVRILDNVWNPDCLGIGWFLKTPKSGRLDFRCLLYFFAS